MTGSFSKASFDFDKLEWLTNPWRELDLQAVALGLIRIPPEKGYTFMHRHTSQEEVYVIVEGSGQMLVDGEMLELARGDVVRVAPNASRALKAHGDGLFFICAGAVPPSDLERPSERYLIEDGVPDYDDVPPWAANDPAALALNKRFKEAAERREKGEG